MIEFKPSSNKTDVGAALRYLTNVLKKKTIVFVLSDFFDERYERTLKIVGNKHDVTGIRIFDEKEEKLPNLGVVQVFDAEQGGYNYVNTGSRSVRNDYAKATLGM